MSNVFDFIKEKSRGSASSFKGFQGNLIGWTSFNLQWWWWRISTVNDKKNWVHKTITGQWIVDGQSTLWAVVIIEVEKFLQQHSSQCPNCEFHEGLLNWKWFWNCIGHLSDCRFPTGSKAGMKKFTNCKEYHDKHRQNGHIVKLKTFNWSLFLLRLNPKVYCVEMLKRWCKI